MKKLTSIAALAALVAGLCAPNAANAATASGGVTVQWSTTVTAALALNVNYVGTTGAFSAGASNVNVQNNGGVGTCVQPGVTTTGIVDFGTVTGDATKITDCLYRNAVNAQVTTNSSNWGLQEKLSAAPTGGYTLCAFSNGFAYGASGAQAGLTVSPGNAAFTSARAAVAGAACTGGLTLSAANQDVLGTGGAGVTTPYSATAAQVGQDLQLIVPAAPPGGAQAPTLTFTLTAV